jgi:lipopolysaccharide transport system ATP-binding protein
LTLNHGSRNATDFWALRDVSFSLQRGETLGIVGPNGAGKSTLLKLIAGISEPTCGRVAVNGRISALIELIAGFHPDLTGRENIYLNASILGLKRREIRARFDSIVAFAEMETFLDTPVKRYSSGMQARLGFAVAAHVEPDLLLVDEVLAVGDLSFQQKCMEHMQRLCRQGVSVVLISHSMQKISSFCRRGLMLVGGELRADGAMPEVALKYFDFLQRSGLQAPEAMVRSVTITDHRGRPLTDVPSGRGLSLRVDVTLPRPLMPALELKVVRADGLLCAHSVLEPGTAAAMLGPGDYEFTVGVRGLPLVRGLYVVDLAILDRGRLNAVVEQRQGVASLLVTGPVDSQGVVRLRADLHVQRSPIGDDGGLKDGSKAASPRPVGHDLHLEQLPATGDHAGLADPVRCPR